MRVQSIAQVVVKNEFHLPYRAVIRVFFGEKSLKTIEATAVPTSEGTTTLHWKIYRNFALTHPLDEGPINKVSRAGFSSDLSMLEVGQWISVFIFKLLVTYRKREVGRHRSLGIFSPRRREATKKHLDGLKTPLPEGRERQGIKRWGRDW